MVTLAVLPGMARASVVAKLANPGNFSGVIKLLVPQSGVVGLVSYCAFTHNQGRAGAGGNGGVGGKGGNGGSASAGAITASRATLTVEHSSFTDNQSIGGAGGNGGVGGNGGNSTGGA